MKTKKNGNYGKNGNEKVYIVVGGDPVWLDPDKPDTLAKEAIESAMGTPGSYNAPSYQNAMHLEGKDVYFLKIDAVTLITTDGNVPTKEIEKGLMGAYIALKKKNLPKGAFTC